MRLFALMLIGMIGVLCLPAQEAEAGYPDGMNTYAYYAGMRSGVDPSGLAYFKTINFQAEPEISYGEKYKLDFVPNPGQDPPSSIMAQEITYEVELYGAGNKEGVVGKKLFTYTVIGHDVLNVTKGVMLTDTINTLQPTAEYITGGNMTENVCYVKYKSSFKLNFYKEGSISVDIAPKRFWNGGDTVEYKPGETIKGIARKAYDPKQHGTGQLTARTTDSTFYVDGQGLPINNNIYNIKNRSIVGVHFADDSVVSDESYEHSITTLTYVAEGLDKAKLVSRSAMEWDVPEGVGIPEVPAIGDNDGQ